MTTSMNSPDRRASDRLDMLIRRALVESVENEEPPAHVWERIRAELTRPKRRATVRWSGPMLQAALLVLLLAFSVISVWQERSVEQYTPPASSEASPMAPPTWYGDDSSAVDADTVAEKIAILRELRSSQARASVTEERRQRTLGAAISADDILPDPSSLQAKALFLRSSRETEPAGGETGPAEGGAKPEELPVYTPGHLWQ